MRNSKSFNLSPQWHVLIVWYEPSEEEMVQNSWVCSPPFLQTPGVIFLLSSLGQELVVEELQCEHSPAKSKHKPLVLLCVTGISPVLSASSRRGLLFLSPTLTCWTLISRMSPLPLAHTNVCNSVCKMIVHRVCLRLWHPHLYTTENPKTRNFAAASAPG